MQEILIILALVSVIDFWINEMVFPICYTTQKPNRLQRIFKKIFNRKPFNCEPCLSMWIGITLSVLTFNIFYLSLPLITKLKNRVI